MKRIIPILFLFYFINSCSTKKELPKESMREITQENTMKLEVNEDEEYDLIVLDPQYNTYLLTIAKPMNFYSENYYKMKNQFYVMEWNMRFSQPMRYDPDFYSVYIDYNPKIKYGINLEYKLFNYFQFINWRYKVNLNSGR